MIRRIELLNFKAHGKASFKFGDGVNFIYGPNGSGKTSIMEAISVALFGSQWVRKVGGKWADYLRRGATSGEVKLYMSHMGNEILIVRKFGENGTTPSGTYMSINGSIIARGDADVTAAVINKLGIGIEEYRNLLYIRQGELRRVLQEAEYIDKILRLDEFDKLDELLRELLNELRAKRERVGGKWEELERRRQLLATKTESLRQRLAELEKKLGELAGVKEKYLEAERRYLKLKEQYVSLAKEREGLEKKFEELAQAAIEAERDLELLEKEIEEIKRASEELKGLPQIGDVEREYYELRQLISIAEKIPPEARSYDPVRLEEARRRLEEATKRLAEVNTRLELIRDVVRLASRAEGGVCPICGSPLRPEAVKRHELELAGLEREVKRLEDLVQQLRAEVRKYESLDKLYQAYKDYLKIDLTSAKRKLAELEELYRKKTETEKRRSYLTALVERERDVAERIKEVRRRLEENEKRIKEVSSRLSQIDREVEEVKSSLEEAEALYQQLRVKHDEYLATEALVRELKAQLKDAESELESVKTELEKMRGEIEKLDKALATGKNIRNTLGEIKPLARQILLRAINEELNYVFLKLRHKESFKSAQLVELNGRYVARISTPTGYIEHNLLSLGEQNLLALSIRVALARALLGGAPFMMLDEPTEHLDEEHRRRIVELVRDLTSVVPTIVVTSHLGEFEEVADVVIQL
ncbi:AAA family ATPase [Pyrobaculum aerophilum]|uniref:Chromosome segregation protein SMC n=1 Tax=Pyrobaculum aerophilum TaxID=13773 RepID=A0A371QZV9_9CREN|nr:SMC family ATPase [Pyrobaculum aerophilum]RFA96243.1 chromosome segregation protein SMC [Pyrobaculum aerophilum]RFB00379.1 chromosome segregation protein SMC [Pyrobaculum aerophilum]